MSVSLEFELSKHTPLVNDETTFVCPITNERSSDPRSVTYIKARLALWSAEPFSPIVISTKTAYHDDDITDCDEDVGESKEEGGVLCLAFKRILPDAVVSALQKIIHQMNWDTESKSCRACSDFLLNSCRLVGSDANMTPLHAETPVQYKFAAERIHSSPPVYNELVSLSSLELGHSQLGKCNKTGRLFHHLSRKVARKTSVPTREELDATLPAHEARKVMAVDDYVKGIRHWLPIFRRTFSELCGDDMVASVTAAIELLPKVPYGDKLVGSARWFLRALLAYNAATTEHERVIVLLRHMVPSLRKAGLSVDCPVMSQFNGNTRNLMEHAGDATAFEKMVAERMNPTRYRQSTTEASGKQLVVAASILEDHKFSASLIPLNINDIEVVLRDISHVCLFGEVGEDLLHSAVSGASLLRHKAAAKAAGGAKGFAVRVSSTPTFVPPKTFTELLSLSPDTLAGLQVDTLGCIPVVISSYPDSARPLFSTQADKGILWNFFNGGMSLSRTLGVTLGWHPVTLMCTLGDRSVFVGVAGAKPISKESKLHATHECFLADEFARGPLRKSMAELKKQEMVVDPSKQYALGFGNSRMVGDKLAFRMNFRLGRTSFSIDMI